MALALPGDGRIVCCDVSEEWTAIARRYWKKAGVAGKIDLRLAPALETLDALLEQGKAGKFDFAFIDADKANYANYYERCLKLVRRGGLIAVDNTLWGGSVVDPRKKTVDTLAIRAFNRKLVARPARGDGAGAGRRRPQPRDETLVAAQNSLVRVAHGRGELARSRPGSPRNTSSPASRRYTPRSVTT